MRCGMNGQYSMRVACGFIAQSMNSGKVVNEFGIFSDEGCVERGFFGREDAEAAVAERYSADDGVHVAECCHDHPDHERFSCEECNAEDES